MTSGGFESYFHEWTPFHPCLQVLSGSLFTKNLGNNLPPLGFVTYRVRPSWEVGPEATLQVKDELRVGKKVSVPGPSPWEPGDEDPPVDIMKPNFNSALFLRLSPNSGDIYDVVLG